jgi:hypothetical protein
MKDQGISPNPCGNIIKTEYKKVNDLFKQIWNLKLFKQVYAKGLTCLNKYDITKSLNMFKQVKSGGGIKAWENMRRKQNSCYVW